MSKNINITSISLVEMFFRRDERALELTQSEYGKYCFAIANNILGNDQDAEECVNDAYLRVWNSIPPSRPDNFKAFIVKITRNLAIDKIKHRMAEKRNAPVIAFEELESTLSSDNLRVSEDIDLFELQSVINRFLHTQTVRDRAIFILRYFYCEPVKTIAAKMSTTESNTSKILASTRKKLKDYMKREGYYV